MHGDLAARIVRPKPPSFTVGFTVGALFVLIETGLEYWLGFFAPRDAVAVTFVLGVVAIALVWGTWLAVLVGAVSIAAYDVVFVPSLRHLDMRDRQAWAETALFLVAAMLASGMAALARARAVDSIERREEADLLADLSRLVLTASDVRSALPEASSRLARAMRLPFAAIELGAVPGDDRRLAYPLRCHAEPGTLLIPADTAEPVRRRLGDRVVPPLETLLAAACEREAMSNALRELATEQAVMRRLAVLVARGVPPGEVVAAVAGEAAALLDADATRLLRYEPSGMVSVIAEHGRGEGPTLLGRRFPVEGGVTEQVQRTSLPARVEGYEERGGALADLARREGHTAAVAAPITVEGRVWGALLTLWSQRTPPPDTEARLAEFTELVATAVANTESRAELNASRARIVFAADKARRSFERDLHDGVQQRLVSLGLELRAIEAEVPDCCAEIRPRLGCTIDGLTRAFQDLQEISRGLHPAILSQGGLRAALKTLARRCPVPVTINAGPERRLPSAVEIAAYYVVSEALTNATKHAKASSICVDVDITGEPGSGREFLVLSISDDGAGGADPARGSGLVGLADRVAALGGSLRMTSPPGHGTSLIVRLPANLDDPQPGAVPAGAPACPGGAG